MSRPGPPFKIWEMLDSGILTCVETFNAHFTKCQNELEAIRGFQQLPLELRQQIQREVRLSTFAITLNGPSLDAHSYHCLDIDEEDTIFVNSRRHGISAWACHFNGCSQSLTLKSPDSKYYIPRRISTDLSQIPDLERSQWFCLFNEARAGPIFAAEAAEAFYTVNCFTINSWHFKKFLDERARLWTVRKFIRKLDVVVRRYDMTPDLDVAADLAPLIDLPRLTDVKFILLNNEPKKLATVVDIMAALKDEGVRKISLQGQLPIRLGPKNSEEVWPMCMKGIWGRISKMRASRRSIT